MKKLLILGFAMLTLAACNQRTEEHEHQHEIHAPGVHVDAQDGMFIHVSSEDPHRVLMAMKMAEVISEDHEVLMYFDIKGVEVLVRDAVDFTYADFTSSYAQIKKLSDKGVIMMACPSCLKAAGYTPTDLMEGIEIANKDKFFSFTSGRIITLDY